MKIIEKLKEEKGLTGVDLTISIGIVMIFVSIITALFYNNYVNTQGVKRTTEANSYVSNVFGQVMRSKYEEVTNEKLVEYANLLENGKVSASNNANASLNTPYRMYINVVNYKDFPENVGKNLKDYLKRVDITIKYNVGKVEQTKTYSTVKQIEIE